VIVLPLIQINTGFEFIRNLMGNPFFLIAITLLLTLLMNAELPLFSLKFKNYKLQNNLLKYFFLATSLLMLLLGQYSAIPLVILLYVVLSVVGNLKTK